MSTLASWASEITEMKENKFPSRFAAPHRLSPARRYETVVACIILVLALTGTSGCSKRGGPSTSTSSLVGNWETSGQLTGTKRVFYLSEGGTGVVDTLGDAFKPDIITHWAFDGATFTYTTAVIDRPDSAPITRSYRCVLSPDGNSFRILMGDKGFDSDPIAKEVSTYYRAAK